MKKKLYFLLAASVALFSACSSDDLSEGSSAKSSQMDDTAVNFGAYVNRGITRAGAAGTLTTNGDAPAVSLQNVGFGVFSYYSDSESYSETSKPNFMYNQLVSVKPNETDWSYSPLKYWPNEFGKNARSEGQDRLTFFAYAPYVQVNPSTGRVLKDENNPDETSATSGIVGMTNNTTSGDPYVKYYVDMDPDKRVDLCWGVAKEPFTATVDEDALNDVQAGEPFIDVVKPTTGSKINFDFKHALASVNVQIDTDIDVEGHNDGSAEVDRYTRIWVRSVTFEGFTDKGRLNLNSKAGEGPQWFDLTNESPVASGVVTVFDGRTDGKEGRENAIAKEVQATLNAKIIQSDPYDQAALKVEDETAKCSISDAVPGVRKVAVNLFATDGLTEPVYVIPTDENLKVTIVYDVETYDPNLATFLSDGAVRGSSVQNTIEQDIVFQDGSDNVTKLEAGKQYIIKLHLGLTSVKFDASVTDWVDPIGTDVDLPYNKGDEPVVTYFSKEEANEYNVLHTIAGAWFYGEARHPDADEIAAHNEARDVWDENTVKTPAVMYTLDDPDLIAHNAAVDIWTAPKDKTGWYSFTSYNTADPTQEYGNGQVSVVNVDGEYTIVQVEENEADPTLAVTHTQYAVHALDLTGGTTFELLTADGYVATGISVKNVAQVQYTDEEIAANNALPQNQMWDENTVKTPAVYYDPNDPDDAAAIAAHNALPEQIEWDANTELNPTDDEVTAHNQTVAGAAYEGCARDANGDPIAANNNNPGNDPGNDPGNNPGNDPAPSRPYFSSSPASNNYPVLAPWRR